MIQVYSAEHPTEAYMVKGILESKGIESVVRGETLFAARGVLPVTPDTEPSVWIMENSRYEEARIIVWKYEKAKREQSSAEDVWLCLSCGEESEGQFTHCWRCGMPRHLPVVKE